MLGAPRREATMSAGMATALVTAAVSLLLSIATALLAYATRIRGDTRIAKLQSQLTDEREGRNAQRDYEYDARKRLYTELQPLLFQVVERAKRALDRIQGSFVEGSRDGSVKWPGRLGFGWEDDNYHMSATVWDLFVPLALVRGIQHKLTSVDLSVDPIIRWQYTLASEAYDVWTRGSLADQSPRIDYSDEERPNRQHLLSGHLEHLIDVLLENDDGSARDIPISYATFQARFVREDLREVFEHATYPFTDAHLGEKRVLWRILAVQAHLYAALIQTFDAATAGERRGVHPLHAVTTADRTRYDWRNSHDTRTPTPDPDLEAARTYLQSRFPTMP